MIRERTDALKEGDPLPVERYRWASSKLKGVYVADVCCGFGYGTALLRGFANERVVVGVDIDLEAINYAQISYPGLYLLANAETQNFKGFDAVVCLEGISHMIDPYAWLKNLDVPELVVSAPLTPSKNWYPWRKHDIEPQALYEMFTPKWEIVDRMRQRRGGGSTTEYVTIYARKPEAGDTGSADAGVG